MNVELIKSAAKLVSSKNSIIYRMGEARPDYHYLFDWTVYDNSGLEYDPNISDEQMSQSSAVLFGQLKESYFDTIEKKIAYLSGVIEYDTIDNGVIALHGKYEQAKRCKDWINEVAKYVGENKIINNTVPMFGHFDDFSVTGVIGCGHLYSKIISYFIYVNPLIVEFIKNYKFN